MLAIDYLVRFGEAVAVGLRRSALSVICVERAGAERHLRGAFALWSEAIHLLDRKFCSRAVPTVGFAPSCSLWPRGDAHRFRCWTVPVCGCCTRNS